MAFQFKAGSLGFAVAKPFGDSLPYDFLVDGGGIITRVQVKTTSAVIYGAYFANAQRHSPFSSRPYTPEEVEIIAIWVKPLDTWYLIPVSEVAPRKSIRLWPHRPEKDTRYGKYRERWEELGQPKFAIEAQAEEELCHRAPARPAALRGEGVLRSEGEQWQDSARRAGRAIGAGVFQRRRQCGHAPAQFGHGFSGDVQPVVHVLEHLAG
jgi:hypothetical protein